MGRFWSLINYTYSPHCVHFGFWKKNALCENCISGTAVDCTNDLTNSEFPHLRVHLPKSVLCGDEVCNTKLTWLVKCTFWLVSGTFLVHQKTLLEWPWNCFLPIVPFNPNNLNPDSNLISQEDLHYVWLNRDHFATSPMHLK